MLQHPQSCFRSCQMTLPSSICDDDESCREVLGADRNRTSWRQTIFSLFYLSTTYIPRVNEDGSTRSSGVAHRLAACREAESTLTPKSFRGLCLISRLSHNNTALASYYIFPFFYNPATLGFYGGINHLSDMISQSLSTKYILHDDHVVSLFVSQRDLQCTAHFVPPRQSHSNQIFLSLTVNEPCPASQLSLQDSRDHPVFLPSHPSKLAASSLSVFPTVNAPSVSPSALPP